MVRWNHDTLENVCNRIYSGGTPSTSHPEYWNGNIKWLSSGETGQRFIYDTNKKITEIGVKNSATKLARKDSTVVATAGQGYTRGQVSYLMTDTYVNQSVLILEADPMKINPLYLYYNLDNRYEEFRLLSDGTSTRGGLSGWIVRRMEIDYPPIEEQEKIVSILYSIDKKIEENNRINNNLEQQAQAIFLEMFPNIFSSSASSTFQNLIEFSNGKKRPEATGNIPVYGGNGILAYTNQANAENCVIIGRVGAYCGNTFLCPEKCWTSDNAIQAKSKKEDSPLFIYYLLKNASLPSRHIGTGQPLMTQGILNSIPVNKPSVQAISSFISICKPMHELIFTNERQNMSLALLRDSLLPKLMSGELDVSDIDL